MSPNRLQSETEEKLQQRVNILKKELHRKEIKLSKIYQELKHLKTEGKYFD